MSAYVQVSEELDVPPEIAFARLCAVERWPVWFTLVKRATISVDAARLAPGADVHLWNELNRGREEVYEVEECIEPYVLTFVGAFSCRRRIEFRIERQQAHARIAVRIGYPVYGGGLLASLDRVTLRPRFVAALEHSLETFKGLVEHDALELRERAAV